MTIEEEEKESIYVICPFNKCGQKYYEGKKDWIIINYNELVHKPQQNEEIIEGEEKEIQYEKAQN